MVKGRRY